MIGNSSSGLLEMPYFRKGTVNIGEDNQEDYCLKVLLIQSSINRKYKKSIKKIISKKIFERNSINKFTLWKTGSLS